METFVDEHRVRAADPVGQKKGRPNTRVRRERFSFSTRQIRARSRENEHGTRTTITAACRSYENGTDRTRRYTQRYVTISIVTVAFRVPGEVRT